MKSRALMGVLLLLVFSSLTHPQGLRLGIGGGVARIESPVDYTRSISSGFGMGLVTEYSVGGKAVLSFAASPLNLVGSVAYHFMRATGNYSSEIYAGPKGDIEVKTHFTSVSLGGQWSILSGPIAPYIGVSILLSSFGEVTRTVSNQFEVFESSFGGGTQGGLGVVFGAELHLLPNMDVELNVAQNLYGFFSGYAFGVPNLNTIGVNANVLFTIM